jgi:hypothetical protein
MKKNLSIIFSLIALVGVVVLAVVMACLNVSLSNVSLDTFIGVMVTMMGILVRFWYPSYFASIRRRLL